MWPVLVTDGPKVTAYPGYSHVAFKEIVLLLVYSDPSHANCITSMWHCHAKNNLLCIERQYSTQISWLLPWYPLVSWDILNYFKDIFWYGYRTVIFINYPLNKNLLTVITYTWILAVNWHICILHRLWTCNQYCACLVQMCQVLFTDRPISFCISWLQSCNNYVGAFKEVVLLLVYSDPSNAHCITSIRGIVMPRPTS